MEQESDIQIISDHFASQLAQENGTVQLENRFRMYHGGAQPASVNPDSYHAFQKAYDDLKTRFNEVTTKSAAFERQLRACKAQIAESNMASSSRYTYRGDGEEHGDRDILDRQDSFKIRRRYVTLAQEHQETLDEVRAYQEDLAQAKKRITDLENTNRGLLEDNRTMMGTNRDFMTTGYGETTETEHLTKKLQQMETDLQESNQKCVEFQREIDLMRHRNSQAVSKSENMQTDSESQTDENWALFAQLQVQNATKEAQEMRCFAKQQHTLLVQLLACFSNGTASTAVPSLMTRSAPGHIGLPVDPNLVSVEIPSDAEQFPIIFQPRGTTARMQRPRAPLRNTCDIPQANVSPKPLPALQEEFSNLQMSHAGFPGSQTATGMPLGPQQTARPAANLQDPMINNLGVAGLVKPHRKQNVPHEPQQCSDDLFLQNVIKNKNNIVMDIIEEQRRQPLLPNRKSYAWDRQSEPVGTVFSTSSSSGNSQYPVAETSLHPDDVFTDNEASPNVVGLQASEQAAASLRRHVPVEPGDDRSGFSLMEDYETTVQAMEGMAQPTTPERALFTFELNEGNVGAVTENRHHPSAFNQQPRQLNIDRNYSDEHRRRGSYDNTSSNRNINDAGNQRKSSLDDPYVRPSNNPPVLNNDPLWTPKCVPTQNLYSNHTPQTERRRPPVPTESQRICPVCDVDFPADMSQDDVQAHVNICLNEDTATLQHGPATSEAMARDERKCPICATLFPEDAPISAINRHVNSHFDNNPLNFEIIEPD